MPVQQPIPDPPKPGTTRLAFIAVGAIIAIFGFIVCLYVWRADAASIEKIALMVAGSLISTIGAVTGYIFGKTS